MITMKEPVPIMGSFLPSVSHSLVGDACLERWQVLEAIKSTVMMAVHGNFRDILVPERFPS